MKKIVKLVMLVSLNLTAFAAFADDSDNTLNDIKCIYSTQIVEKNTKVSDYDEDEGGIPSRIYSYKTLEVFYLNQEGRVKLVDLSVTGKSKNTKVEDLAVYIAPMVILTPLQYLSDGVAGFTSAVEYLLSNDSYKEIYSAQTSTIDNAADYVHYGSTFVLGLASTLDNRVYAIIQRTSKFNKMMKELKLEEVPSCQTK